MYPYNTLHLDLLSMLNIVLFRNLTHLLPSTNVSLFFSEPSYWRNFPNQLLAKRALYIFFVSSLMAIVGQK
jgi:hypothetical protein